MRNKLTKKEDELQKQLLGGIGGAGLGTILSQYGVTTGNPFLVGLGWVLIGGGATSIFARTLGLSFPKVIIDDIKRHLPTKKNANSIANKIEKKIDNKVLVYEITKTGEVELKKRRKAIKA